MSIGTIVSGAGRDTQKTAMVNPHGGPNKPLLFPLFIARIIALIFPENKVLPVELEMFFSLVSELQIKIHNALILIINRRCTHRK